MADAVVQGGDAQLAMASASPAMNGKLEEADYSSANWYFSREEIEKHSPSRKDGIDLRKETYFRKSYCTFLQELGIRLKVPQVTIATAIVFCHRFFLRQSHAKNDRYIVATICMFIAGKVEETPRPLRDVIWLSYENRFKKDPAVVQQIKQKEVFETEKERVLQGERLVLTTLGFDLNVHHPYKPLVAAIKHMKVAANTLAQVAWNFVNDGLRTSLCLQFKPHHIAAGAIFLAAKFLKVKLPSEGEKAWWQEFEVNPRQLEEVSNQMLELYEQNKSATGSRMSDPSSSAGPYNRLKAMGASQAAAEKVPGAGDKNSPARAPIAVKVEHQEVKTSRLQVENHGGTGEVTEANSSLEDGEDVADSKPRVVSVRTATTTTTTTLTDVTVRTSMSVSEVDSSAIKVFERHAEAADVPEDSKSAIPSLDEVDEKRRWCAVERSADSPSVHLKEATNEEELPERKLESGAVATFETQKVMKHVKQVIKEDDPVASPDIIEEGEVSVGSIRRENIVKEEDRMVLNHKLEHGLREPQKAGVNEGTENGEAGAAARRKRGFGGVDAPGIDRKKTKEHGEWADVSKSGRSPGPVEEGELPSANQAMEMPLSPSKLGEKRPHPSGVGPDRGVLSPDNHRRRRESRWEPLQSGHRDGRHGGHARDYQQIHGSHYPSHSYRQTTHQHRGEGDRDWRPHGDREHGVTDHKKIRVY